ncbi:SMC-Scp complex subunit ScpB [Actinomycetaceae bacterium WB03_NA08]|uniref:SMC-Scp complex subunit ScpB n=1 Tax=Scrofimicrobium canadense TaxID=2652290 RepID=A0A6N7W744_9ACTO|nr:SMC-Scp complex subunit ScpB [Scrofimicrobium canadense]MSS83968.1 SMC-Scp complex subunit ScpB [Scrofimicrobium canadense]
MSDVSSQVLSALEAILMITETPATVSELAEAIEIPEYVVRESLEALRDEYAGSNGGRPHGFILREVAGGWRIYSAPQWAPIVGKFVVGQATSQLSQAALETLAIVAYRQPVTRGQISAIRGVNVDSVMRSLQGRGLIEETGTAPGGSIQYGTTQLFLERMGMKDLDDLVPLAPLLPDADSIESLTAEVEERL